MHTDFLCCWVVQTLSDVLFTSLAASDHGNAFSRAQRTREAQEKAFKGLAGFQEAALPQLCHFPILAFLSHVFMLGGRIPGCVMFKCSGVIGGTGQDAPAAEEVQAPRATPVVLDDSFFHACSAGTSLIWQRALEASSQEASFYTGGGM